MTPEFKLLVQLQNTGEMQNVNNIVEEAKKKRSLSDLKPTSLPEGFNTTNTVLPENNNSVSEAEYQNTRKTEIHNSSNTSQKEEKNSVRKNGKEKRIL